RTSRLRQQGTFYRPRQGEFATLRFAWPVLPNRNDSYDPKSLNTRLFDTELEAIAGANTLLESIKTPMCVVSNGPVSKMQHSLGKL
ncbi:hypothetical protein ONK20_25010, partial [Salmonella enterica subsp. enterica serovar Montevideo]|nr:hypothetical protein [Salmonella enterica subsp. enterica serovar Montevideo]